MGHCFVEGTQIATPEGPRPVESLEAGDLVSTLDRGPQPLILCHHVHLRFTGPEAEPDHHRPIEFTPDSLGPGLPDRPLRLSPQHRVLVSSRIAARVTGAYQVLVPAKKLAGMPGILQDSACREVGYCHLLLADHQILLAETCAVESLLLGPQMAELMEEIGTETGALVTWASTEPARPLLESGPSLEALLQRHRKNAKPLQDGATSPEEAALDMLPAV